MSSNLPQTSEEFYTKINAARLFKQNNLDAGHTEIVKIKSTDLSTASALRSFPLNQRITVRFAKGDQLGLPTLFIVNNEETIGIIEDVGRDFDYAIIQGYIEISHSFEIYCNETGWVAEHIPGVWESSENTPPDIISKNGNDECILNYWSGIRKIRLSKFGKNEISLEKKLSKIQWIEISNKIQLFYKMMRQEYFKFMPFIAHSVISVDGCWRFLNIRQGRNISFLEPKKQPPYSIIRSVEELSRWNGEGPILLDFALMRGKENRFLDLAEALPKGMPVYVRGGMLSHPAIVLRSLGVNVQSAKSVLGGGHAAEGYQSMKFDIDYDNDPIDRIFLEPPTIGHPDFHIVPDREPISKGHLLFVTKSYAPSIADAGLGKVLHTILSDLPPTADGNWIVWERGRASFCTSALTTNHAHCHFLPLPSSISNPLSAFPELGAEEFSEIPPALERASEREGEYLLMLASTGQARLYLPSPIGSSQKRYVRKRLMALLSESAK